MDLMDSRRRKGRARKGHMGGCQLAYSNPYPGRARRRSAHPRSSPAPCLRPGFSSQLLVHVLNLCEYAKSVTKEDLDVARMGGIGAVGVSCENAGLEQCVNLVT